MKKYMYIIKKNKYCLILALFILSFYLGRGVCALAKNTGKNTNSTVIVIDPGMEVVDNASDENNENIRKRRNLRENRQAM